MQTNHRLKLFFSFIIIFNNAKASSLPTILGALYKAQRALYATRNHIANIQMMFPVIKNEIKHLSKNKKKSIIQLKHTENMVVWQQEQLNNAINRDSEHDIDYWNQSLSESMDGMELLEKEVGKLKKESFEDVDTKKQSKEIAELELQRRYIINLYKQAQQQEMDIKFILRLYMKQAKQEGISKTDAKIMLYVNKDFK